MSAAQAGPRILLRSEESGGDQREAAEATFGYTRDQALGSEMAEQEATWALAQLGTLSDTQRDVVRQMADRLVRRVLYPVSRNIHDE